MVLSCPCGCALDCRGFKVQVPCFTMFPGLRNYGPGARKDSAIRTLVAETLVLAKTHGCVEKIESELEEELRRESKGQGSDPLSKWRRRGDKALKSKYMLLTVALFCVTDCALVLGELILDLHKVKDTLETSERVIYEFKKTLSETYPSHIADMDTDIKDIFDLIIRSRIIWQHSVPSSANLTTTTTSPPHLPHLTPVSSGHLSPTGSVVTSSSATGRSIISLRRRRSDKHKPETEVVLVYQEGGGDRAVGGGRWGQRNRSGEEPEAEGTVWQGHGRGHGKSTEGHTSLEEKTAHILHLISITLMSILVLETCLKAVCAGLPFFKRKLEFNRGIWTIEQKMSFIFDTFDFFIVMVSFLVDIVFMQILPRFKIQDFVFILAFLLPWRVIRVVNSLVVAVQDHEHFRLKMMYSRKKKIQNSLREAELKLQLFKAQCCALKRLCLNEGVEEEKIEAIVQLDEYVVNKTGKSKCKIRIDNSSVILLDKCDFPRLSPRPSLASLWEKRKSFQADASGVGKSDKFSKRNGHMLTADDALGPDVRGKGKGRKSSFSFSNGPFSSLFGSKDLHVVPEVVKVRRAGSQGQICEAIKRDFLGVDRKVKRGSSHNQLCQVTVTNEMGGMTSPVFPDDRTKGSSMDHLPGKNPNAKNIRDAASDTVLSRDCDTAGKNLRGSGTQSAPVLSEDKWTQTGGSGGSDGHTVDDSYEKGAHRSDLQNTDSSAPSIPNKHLDVATAGTGSPFLPCPCPPVSPKQKRSASLPTERISVLVTQHDDQPYIQKTRANSLGPGSMHIIVECPRNTSVSIGSAEADPAEFQHQEENHKPRTVSEEMSDVSKDVGVSEDSPGTVLTGEVKQSSNSPENPVSEVREVTGWYLGDLDESSLPPGPGQHSRSQDHSQTAGTSSRQSGFLSDDQVAMPDTSEDDSQSPSADRVIQGKVVRISSTEATNQGSSREHVNDAISEKDS